MLPVLKEDFGNASSVHSLGRKARYLVEDARERIAGHLGSDASEIVFTSGGTEANNTAILGTERLAVISTPAEHESVLRAVSAVGDTGRQVSLVEVLPNGLLNLEQLEMRLADCDSVPLVSVMSTNNETGAVNDLRQIADIVHAANGHFHCDAVQAAAHEPLDVDALDVDLLTLSGHKLNGPKGVGILYIRAGMQLNGLMVGGSQERGRRAGTENVAAIVGMAAAMDLARAEMEERATRLRVMQSFLIERIEETMGARVVFNTPRVAALRAPHIVNISFPPFYQGVDGEMILLGLDLEGVCVSSGSACTSGTIRPSHVLLAMGRDENTAKASVRFSIGPTNTTEDIERATDALKRVADRVIGEETNVG